MSDYVQINEDWGKDEPIYKEIAKIAKKILLRKSREKGITVEITWRTKELTSLIKKIKKKSLEKPYKYRDVTDKLGVRVVCSFNNELSKIDEIIAEDFVLKNRDIKAESIEYNALGYTSNHYDVALKDEKYCEYIFEIQSRTLNQDIWARITHKLSYKNNSILPDSVKRSIYRLSAIYELADEEFNRIYCSALEQNISMEQQLLNTLETYSFTLAQSDYDREISIFYIEKIINFFGEEDQKQIVNKIENFIDKAREHILLILKNNIENITGFSWMLTQPEVFLIWYCIENHFYVIRDNWIECLDREEFQYLTNLWGKSTNL